MLSSLSKQVLARIQKEGWLRPGDRVGVAVSGGADSVALLLLLMEVREELGIRLSVVHLNHKLRGKASDADEHFVTRLAERHGLEFALKRHDVADEAKKKKLNLEDAGRRERYVFFTGLVNEGRLERVAVGHTADDQAETVLSHILRGTGLAGLSGIHPKNGCVIRPLLGIRRGELRKYLRLRKQSWREDATNRDSTRMRARIRGTLLPMLEKRFHRAAVEHLANLAELARRDEAYLDAVARERAAKLKESSADCVRVGIADLMREERAIVTRIIRRIAADLRQESKEDAGSRGGQLNAEHVEAVLTLAAHGQSGKSLPLPGGIVVQRERAALAFVAAERRPVEKGQQCAQERKQGGLLAEVELSGKSREIRVAAPKLSCVFRFRVIDWPPKRGETNLIGAALDREKLRFPLVLRSWRPGDRLRLQGHRTARKLKRLLNERHISRWKREGWPVLVSGGVIVWARGLPVAEGYAAGEGTRAGVAILEEQAS